MSTKGRATKELLSRLGPFKQKVEQRGLAYTSARDAVFRGELQIVRLGRAWYLDDADLEQFIAKSKERASRELVTPENR